MRKEHALGVLGFIQLVAITGWAESLPPAAKADIDHLVPDLQNLYMDLHRNPELSLHEKNTAKKIADRLRTLGYEVTTGVGGNGVVAVMRNGQGPTLMLRTEMDALPVLEKTGLPYASKVTTKDDSGATVSVMHACGHDMHMASLIGTASVLAKQKQLWQGTLVLIGQPAEERVSGAEAMLKDGLFTRFPKPNFAIALHDSAEIASGKVAYVPGFALASADSVDITIYGRGGHGAYPHKTVDPIVIAARTILALQTIVSRESNPLDPTVITVGSIHAGSKHNIVPDEAKLLLTVRTYKDDVRKRVLESIKRVSVAEALAAGAPKEPEVVITESTGATYNDPELTRHVAEILTETLGSQNVLQLPPEMGAEDFGAYSRAGVPSVTYRLGAVEPKRLEDATRQGKPLPSLHSSEFAPDPVATLRTGIASMTSIAMNLLAPKP